MQTRLLFGRPDGPPPPQLDGGVTPQSPREGISHGGERYLWCWETERYEIASRREEAEAASIAARAEAARKLAEKAEREEKKKTMKPRERKKADAADAEKAQAEAAEKTQADADAAAAAAAAQAALEADPVAMHAVRYGEAVHGHVAGALRLGLDGFLRQADEMEREEPLS